MQKWNQRPIAFLSKNFPLLWVSAKKLQKIENNSRNYSFFSPPEPLSEKKLFDTGAVISRGQLESKTKLLKELPLLGVDHKCKVNA